MKTGGDLSETLQDLKQIMKMTEMRCTKGCCDDVYPDREAVLRMAEGETNGRASERLLSQCPKCGGSMEVNYGEHSSFQGKKNWQEKAARYQGFVDLMHGKRLVILEFGVGWRNHIIKMPFMQLTVAEPHARYITFNTGEIYIPDKIQGKSIGVAQDSSCIA